MKAVTFVPSKVGAPGICGSGMRSRPRARIVCISVICALMAPASSIFCMRAFDCVVSVVYRLSCALASRVQCVACTVCHRLARISLRVRRLTCAMRVVCRLSSSLVVCCACCLPCAMHFSCRLSLSVACSRSCVRVSFVVSLCAHSPVLCFQSHDPPSGSICGEIIEFTRAVYKSYCPAVIEARSVGSTWLQREREQYKLSL